MPLKKLSRKEREKLIADAKKGDKLKVGILIESFQGLKNDNYNHFIYRKANISKEEYEQECSMKIIECINEFSEKTYGQLSSLVKKSLKHYTFDFIEKNRNFDSLNILCEDTINDYKENTIDESYKFDDLVVSNMTVGYCYNNFIKVNLSREEDKVFSTYISGKSIHHYADVKGVKLESVKRTFRRAINKIINKEQIKEFYSIVIIIFIYLQKMWEYIDFMNITELI